MTRTAISIQSVTKSFDQFQALSDISLDIKEGEFFTLLGPSGCGKTTLLRLLAGFEETTSGQIKLFEENIAHKPANQRPINTVFQHYSLFPHLDIHENVQFGLKMLGIEKRERESRASEMLEMVQLTQFAKRRPHQLSGGQQQRVALARALAPRPKLLLLDEPLSALDLKLRQSMRLELKKIQEQTGITFVFVTHDQEEALTMSDRIAVMSAGHVQQIGSPTDIYERPSNKFVADFIGETNLIDVAVLEKHPASATINFSLPDSTSSTEMQVPYDHKVFIGTKALLSIRPERINLSHYDVNSGKPLLKGKIKQTIYMGTDTQYIVDIDESQSLLVRQQNTSDKSKALLKGDDVGIDFDLNSCRLLRS
ncbi:ABC transporter ATP-binding protein [Vibrio viridaestus]|uniref:Spermidine/putrescine import ATP-binding protein PotA n=1 Tax=Vibrio viridaestus TaxID=2487322 RepID=A0A3N9TEI9_9VIBR|nr:ABC transporter ATP-binding protein [Vibrio viridaestus]RQW61865.1 ABC transporter ATP-binding protein [Vibrio viridaestus]